MKPDVYEQEMALDGPVRFRDRHSDRAVIAYALGVTGFVGLFALFGVAAPVVAFLGGVAALGIGLNLAHASYRVVVTPRTLHVQHGFRIQRIPLSAISSVAVVPYEGAIAPKVGRGLHKQSADGAVHAYRAPGLHEMVRITWHQGSRARVTSIASDRAVELAKAIRTRGDDAPRFRVSTSPDAQGEEEAAMAEVEALLESDRVQRG